MIAHFSRLGSKCVELETDERLRIVHDFFRVGEETTYHFDIKETRKKGHDFKDYVCPDTMEFEKDYFKMGDRYGRVLFLREYASYIKDSMVTDLTDLNRNLMMSIDIVPVPTDEAVREAESRLLGVETNITNWQRKQNQNNNFSATVPYDMEQQKKEMKEFLDDLTTRDQRMMFAVLTLVHTADSKKQLDDDTEALLTVARQNLCQFAVLKYQQPDGLNTAMPFGTRKIAAVKSLVAAIAAGGWVAVVVIIVLCLVGLIAGSVYGIFFSGEDSGTGMSMQTAVQEINQEYDDRLEQEKNSVSYDVLEMSGSRAVWKDVLAVYSVKVNTNADNPMEVATVDDTKKQLLSDIFWEMNSISSRTETKSHTEIEESDDGHGNIVETETTVTETFLYITVSHKTVDEMATAYGFNEEQKDYLAELLKDENNQLWSQVLYGIGYSDDQIVSVALSQVGNVGGQPYWSWYGFDSRVEWCACFVSWCANECGYIDAGIIPKYAGCVNGAQWFKDRGQWADRNYEPAPGTIIFFDWEGDGETDHTGIVQKCENGIVYTVEGNSGDACRQRQYAVGSSSIYGYGIPAY